MANIFCDFNGGLDTNNGTSFALRKKTLSSAASVAAAGDVIRVMGNPSTNSGTATWTKNSNTVTLSAAINQLLYGDGAWTALGTNVTQNTTFTPAKEGSNCVQFVCAAAFTTGKIAHLTTAALNLSAYSQVSFWIRATSTIASGAISLQLCSDTGGVTVVNTLTLNVALNANQWTAVTINNGATLGASIQSIKLIANTSLASKTFMIDNIFTAKAPPSGVLNPDCLTLNTLISPDNVTWYHVQSVNGTTVRLDGQNATAAGASKNFQGTTGSTTFFMLQPTVVSIGTASTVYNQDLVAANGAAGNPITISGGWDSTAMTTQSGWTTIDMRDWAASGVKLTGATGFITVDKFNFNHCAIALGVVTTTAKGYSLTNCNVAGAGSSVLSGQPTHGMSVSASNFLNCAGTNYIFDIPANANYSVDQVNWSFSNSKIWGSSVGGVKVPLFVGTPAISITGCDASGNTLIGFDIQSPCAFRNNTAVNNGAAGINFQAMVDMVAYNLTARGNVAGEIQISGADVDIYTLDTNTPGGSSVAQINFPNNTSGKATVYSWTQYTGGAPAAKLTSLGSPATGQTSNNSVSVQKEGGVATNHAVYTDYGSVTTNGVVGQPGSGIAWKLSPNAQAVASTPLRLNIGKIACPANVATTVKFWAKFSAAGPSAQLKVFGGRYAGVGSPGTDIVSAAISGTAFTQYSVTFTPTEYAVVDIFAEVWGSSTQNLVVSGPVVVTQ